jgi:DNA-binding NarL/FixJ family response regulator
MLQAGRLDEAGATALASYHLAVAGAHLSGQALSAWARGRVELARGRLDGAQRWFHESEVLERSLGTTHGRRRWAPAGLAMAMALDGDSADAHRVLDAIEATDRDDPMDVVFLVGEGGRARARAFAADGETARALACLAATIEQCRATGDVSTEIALLHDGMLLAAGRDVRLAAEGLLDRVGRVDGAVADARAAHARAVLDRSASGVVAAAEAFAQLGCLRLAADSASAGARLLDGEAGDRACEALRHLADQWLTSAGGQLTADPDWALRRLAPRQREVARLAAAGLSNAEIAIRLGRSPRTIENHLYRAYQELGVDDRRELIEVLGGEPRGSDGH